MMPVGGRASVDRWWKMEVGGRHGSEAVKRRAKPAKGAAIVGDRRVGDWRSGESDQEYTVLLAASNALTSHTDSI